MAESIEEIKRVLFKVSSALQHAYDHLEYCGYGDSWERECAGSSKLEDKIEIALELAETTLAQSKGDKNGI